ncbi:hypothetical protein GUT184_06150 [Streptococcus ruminantium]|nr:hypothetical protein GUT184_06150 [Streptococcus ruminantium]
MATFNFSKVPAGDKTSGRFNVFDMSKNLLYLQDRCDNISTLFEICTLEKLGNTHRYCRPPVSQRKQQFCTASNKINF